MRNFNLDHLQTLIAIADLGNFAAAAQALHLAHLVEMAGPAHIQPQRFVRGLGWLEKRGKRGLGDVDRRVAKGVQNVHMPAFLVMLDAVGDLPVPLGLPACRHCGKRP